MKINNISFIIISEKLFEERKIFEGVERIGIKTLAILLYFAGLYYRKTSKILRDKKMVP